MNAEMKTFSKIYVVAMILYALTMIGVVIYDYIVIRYRTLPAYYDAIDGYI